MIKLEPEKRKRRTRMCMRKPQVNPNDSGITSGGATGNQISRERTRRNRRSGGGGYPGDTGVRCVRTGTGEEKTKTISAGAVHERSGAVSGVARSSPEWTTRWSSQQDLVAARWQGGRLVSPVHRSADPRNDRCCTLPEHRCVPILNRLADNSVITPSRSAKTGFRWRFITDKCTKTLNMRMYELMGAARF